MPKNDLGFLRAAITAAQRARENGNHPFGAVLVDSRGVLLLEAENTVVTGPDATGHAETNLMRLASRQFEPDFLAGCTLYTSTEPCPMCAGAIFWGNVRRVVYALSQEGLYAMIGEAEEDALHLNCRDVFQQGGKEIEVLGPLIEEEARVVHEGFWGSLNDQAE
ncbi:MAG: nucleoside deaminase [Anaerolineales bacterium]|nr:nucleoside deaminase [Anaerolineales bacterium]